MDQQNKKEAIKPLKRDYRDTLFLIEFFARFNSSRLSSMQFGCTEMRDWRVEFAGIYKKYYGEEKGDFFDEITDVFAPAKLHINFYLDKTLLEICGRYFDLPEENSFLGEVMSSL